MFVLQGSDKALDLLINHLIDPKVKVRDYNSPITTTQSMHAITVIAVGRVFYILLPVMVEFQEDLLIQTLLGLKDCTSLISQDTEHLVGVLLVR